MPDFLLEIQTEELPAGAVGPALSALERMFAEALEENRLEGGRFHAASTPRRLVLAAEGLPAAQPAHTRQARGPARRIAFDEAGRPTKAALGFARSQGVAVEDLVVREVKGTPYLFAVREEAGEPLAAVLARILPEVISRIPWPKSMRWKERNFTFARPIRGLVALVDGEVVPVEAGGVRADRFTPGHPFLAPGPRRLADADYRSYTALLREGFVLVERTERRAAILEGLERIVETHGGRIGEADLLEEVTDLVEWPLVLEGSFDPSFLDLPAPVLVAAMTSHQRYFPVRDAEGRLLPRFAVVANRARDEKGLIVEGNQRVLAGRLADARFFFDEDRKRPLEARLPELDQVLYHERLGSYLDKVKRVEALARTLAEGLGLDETARRRLLRAVRLAKADLVTEMVGEFPELQGVMGREYALADGEDPEVAEAIAEHYQPRQAGADPPATLTGALASLADKFDSVIACFAAGLAPTGSQDPYALRRQMQGIIRIVEERRLRLSLKALFQAARDQLPPDLARQEDLVERVLEFVGDRLYHQAVDEGHPHNLVRAVLAAGFDDLGDFFARLAALRALSEEPLWPGLVELVERTYKIARDAALPEAVDESLLAEPAERALHRRYLEAAPEVNRLLDARDYLAASRAYHDAFARPVHAFFEEVYVNVDDPAVRANRMLLCRLIHRLYAERVADLALVPGRLTSPPVAVRGAGSSPPRGSVRRRGRGSGRGRG